MSAERNNNPIRVCFVMPKAYPLFNPKAEGVFGGAEVDLYYLATELARDDGFKVSFVVADYGQQAVENIEGVEIIKSLDFAKNPISGAMRVWKALSRANADIYIIKTASPGVPLVRTFCRLKNRRFVYRTAHKYECDGTYLKEHWFTGKAFLWSLRRADRVFAQNVDDAEDLRKTIGVESVVIGNGHRLPPLGDVGRQFVLWVGRTAGFKRPEKFITLASRFPGDKFVMICQRATGDGRYEQLLGEAEKVKNLVFHKQVPFAEIDEYFKWAKVLVNTSDSEGFANTFIQAFKAGSPVLSLNVNPDGILDEYNCGKSCNGDEQQLADELQAMLADDKYLQMGQNGRQYVEEKHDITKIVERYKTVFRELV